MRKFSKVIPNSFRELIKEMLKQVQYDIWGVRHDIWGVRHDDSEGFVVLDSSAVNRLRMTFFKGFEMTITVESVIKEQRMKYVLFLMMVLFSGQAVALECVKQPTCEELNYSKDDDPQCADDGYILCPFDFTYKKCLQPDCAKMGYTKSEKSSWCGKLAFCPSDKSYTLCKALCEVGDVYYVDGTCGYATDYDNTKTPVGVVFYVTDEGRHGKVVALKNLQAKHLHSYWSDREGTAYTIIPLGRLKYDFKYYTNLDDLLPHLKAFEAPFFDGKTNTLKMLEGKISEETCLNGTYHEDTREWDLYCQPTVALLAREYVPDQVSADNPITGQNQWYIPSIGEMMQLYGTDFSQIGNNYVDNSGSNGEVLKIVKQTLTTLKKATIQDNTFWTSSPSVSSGTQFCTFKFESGTRASDGSSHSFPIRPVLAF